ncbi:MAG: hypothetical protein D6828_01500, partial [Nitrospirae bacterium]
YQKIRKFSREMNSLSSFLSPYIPMAKAKGFTAIFGKNSFLSPVGYIFFLKKQIKVYIFFCLLYSKG